MATTYYQDIHIDDKSIWNQFQQYMAQEQYSTALSLLSNSQLANKAMIAAIFNEITSQLTDLQNNNDPSFKQDKILCQPQPPVNIQTGEIWFSYIAPYTFGIIADLQYTWGDMDAKNLTWADIDLGGW